MKKDFWGESKVPAFFNIVEFANNDFEKAIEALDEKNIALFLVNQIQKKAIEEKNTVAITRLYSSKIFPVSNKNTKHLDKKCTKLSEEMINKIPKILIGDHFDYENNVILRTDNPIVYSEAILNDYGIGFLTKFAIDISVVDRRLLKIYEPIEDEIMIAILSKKDENINKVELLKSLIKT